MRRWDKQPLTCTALGSCPSASRAFARSGTHCGLFLPATSVTLECSLCLLKLPSGLHLPSPGSGLYYLLPSSLAWDAIVLGKLAKWGEVQGSDIGLWEPMRTTINLDLVKPHAIDLRC